MPEISNARRTAFYLGTGLMVLGVLMFASVFVSFFLSFGKSTEINASFAPLLIRAFSAGALIVIGGIMRSIAARGLAGSGILLNPQQARKDLKPYSRMAGGMLKDVLDETDIDLGSKKSSAEPKVMIRCRMCQQLSPDTANFCQACGERL